MAKSCFGCIYYRKIAKGYPYICNYMLDTGEKRESTPGKKCKRRVEHDKEWIENELKKQEEWRAYLRKRYR